MRDLNSRYIGGVKKLENLVNRRQFLITSTGALLLPVVDGIAGDAGSAVSLGFSLYGMKELPLGEALKACKEIGFSHVEIALNDGYPTAPDAFSAEARVVAAAQLQALKLGLPCLMINASLTADEKAHLKTLALIPAAAKVGRDLNPAVPPILETVVGGKPALWEEQKAGMAEKLTAWADAAEKAQTTIAIKAHVGSAVNSPDRLLWLLDQVKSSAIQVTYDYSHFELQGIDMEESMKALLPRTRFIHAKDTAGDAQKFQFLLPGEGRTDYRKYFGLLKKYGYRGPVCVEVSAQVFKKPGYEPVAAARKSFAALSTAMERVG